jgi:hypothetical protein
MISTTRRSPDARSRRESYLACVKFCIPSVNAASHRRPQTERPATSVVLCFAPRRFKREPVRADGRGGVLCRFWGVPQAIYILAAAERWLDVQGLADQ